jgi:hypothetical protein
MCYKVAHPQRVDGACPGGEFQKMNVPRVVELMTSTAPSPFRSTAPMVDPAPERL